MAPVSIVAPRASWPAEFHAAGVRLRDALGALALQIHHVGSTSVPGLAAKDILDIQVTVATLNEVALTPPLTRGGFVLSSHNRSDHPPAGEPAIE